MNEDAIIEQANHLLMQIQGNAGELHKGFFNMGRNGEAYHDAVEMLREQGLFLGVGVPFKNSNGVTDQFVTIHENDAAKSSHRRLKEDSPTESE